MSTTSVLVSNFFSPYVKGCDLFTPVIEQHEESTLPSAPCLAYLTLFPQYSCSTGGGGAASRQARLSDSQFGSRLGQTSPHFSGAGEKGARLV